MVDVCPICGTEADKGRSRDYGERVQFACPRCGNYEISRTALAILHHRFADQPGLPAVLSHRLRMKQREEEWPLVTSHTLDELTSGADLPSAKEQTANLLVHLSETASHPSDIFITPTDELIAILGTVDDDGVRYIVRHAVDEGFVREGSQGFMQSAEGRDGFAVGLTVRGWDEAEKIKSAAMKKEQPVVPLTNSQDSEHLKVFMCHSKDDKDKVTELYGELVKAGADPWFDEEVLLGGQDWELEIKRGVDGAHVFLAFLSSGMIDKDGYVHKELKLGLETALKKPEGAIYIIPIRLDGCSVPQSLQKYQWIDFWTLRGFPILLKTLQKRAEDLGIPTPIKIPE